MVRSVERARGTPGEAAPDAEWLPAAAAPAERAQVLRMVAAPAAVARRVSMALLRRHVPPQQSRRGLAKSTCVFPLDLILSPSHSHLCLTGPPLLQIQKKCNSGAPRRGEGRVRKKLTHPWSTPAHQVP
jgi:hypothetical protein